MTVPEVQNAMLSTVLLVGSEAFDRFAPVLRRLVVGLIEHAVQLRVVSSDPRVHDLQLGPVQALQHAPVEGLFRQRRLRELAEVLMPPPAVLHAVSSETFRNAVELGGILDSEVVLQVASRADCDRLSEQPVGMELWYLAPSTPLEAMLLQQVHGARGRTHVAPLGVLAGREQVLFGPVDDCAAVFCTTPFVPEGRVDDLLEATAILRRRGRQIMLFLAGEGPMESQLRRLLRLHDLSTAVTLAQPSGDLTPALQSADLFVEPSTEEAIVLDTLEAMAAGVPVACYPNAVSDHLIDGETAAISRAVTPDALAECMERALFEPGMGQRIAQGGLNHVRTNHTVTGMARRTADAYREATRSRATFSIREG